MGTDPQHTDNAGEDQEDDERGHRGARPHARAGALKCALHGAGESLAVAGLVGEGLHGVDGIQRLAGIGGGLGDLVLCGAARARGHAARRR